MEDNPLSIIKVNDNSQTQTTNNVKSRRLEAEAKYERIWLTQPTRFDPNHNALGRERITYTLSIIDQLFDIKGLNIVDIGCGNGILAKILSEQGGKVIASDIATNALKLVPNELATKQEALPETSFQDDEFDLCICTEVIPEMDHRDFRLAIAELARIIKPDGKVVCSTPIDIYSEDAAIRFRKLAETEFKILHWRPSYHSLYLKFLHFLKAPSKFFKAWRDQKKRVEGLKHRHGLNRWWFKINSRLIPQLIWAPIQLILSPVVYLFEQSRILVNLFEKICHFFQHERGISHVIFVAKRRPLLEERDEPPLPDRPPFRREVRWE
ncbi:MAG: Ubiquinone biosynthesis O-methyltransferase [Chlamydiae bacterium]|nr:Ubiquinone biosynthesis O-methyltransferase [Chlamydiota bacterium]